MNVLKILPFALLLSLAGCNDQQSNELPSEPVEADAEIDLTTQAQKISYSRVLTMVTILSAWILSLMLKLSRAVCRRHSVVNNHNLAQIAATIQQFEISMKEKQGQMQAEQIAEAAQGS